MICPLMIIVPFANLINSKKYPKPNCIKEECAWWDSKANYNFETKQFEGQCCILTLSRLKIAGGINTHPY